MNEESHNPPIDPELEARIAAFVLGEASDFERDTLERLIEERPELASLREQLQTVHGLLRDVASGESAAENDDWKLSAEKRTVVLAVIKGEATERSATQVVNKPVENKNRRTAKRNLLWKLARVAAVFCVVGIAATLAVPRLFNSYSNPSSGIGGLALAEKDSLEISDAERHLQHRGDFGVAGPASKNGDSISTADESRFRMEDHNRNSLSALSEIRDSLNDHSSTRGEEADGSDLPSSQVDSSFQTATSRWPSPVYGSVKGLQGEPAADAGRSVLAFPKFSGSLDGRLPVESAKPMPTVEFAAPRLQPGHDYYRANNLESVLDFSGESDAKEPDADGLRASVIGGGQGSAGGQNYGPTLLFGLDPLGEDRLLSTRQAQNLNGRTTANEGRFDSGGGRPGGGDGDGGGGGGVGGGGFGGGGGWIGDGDLTPEKNPSGGNRQNEIFADMLNGAVPGRRTRGRRAAGLASLDLPFPDDGFGLPMPTLSGFGERTVHASPSMPKVDKLDRRTDEGKEQRGDFDAEIAEENGVVNLRSSPTSKSVVSKEELENGKGLGANAAGQPGGDRQPEQSKQGNPPGFGRDSTERNRRGFESAIRAPGDSDSRVASSSTRVSPGTENQANESLEDRSLLGELHKKSYESMPARSGTWFAEEKKSVDTFTFEGTTVTNNGSNVVDANGDPVPNSNNNKLPEARQLFIAGNDLWSGYVPPRAVGESASMKMPPVRRSPVPDGLNEKTTDNETFSTFSLHVSDVSFKLARVALANGVWPEAEKVRIEEFVNAFDYGDPLPGQNEKVACCLEQSIHPFLQQRNLLRISMRTAAAGRSSNTPLRLTFLLDNSGSMERIDRQKTVRRCFALLAGQLTPIDQVTLISFARLPRLLADKVNGSQSHKLVHLIDNLPSEGGTNIEAALKLAFEKAKEQWVDNAQNRIILLTDGAVNLGDANPESLSRMIATMRNAGIAFDAAGICAVGLNDEVLEALTRQGDGRYYLLDSPDAADSGFVRQIAGALRPSAQNVKVQVEFNAKRVGRYKLLGFENRRLKREDFRNDSVDAAEMAAAEAGVAMYQFEAKPDGEGDVGSVSVRFRDLSTGQMIEQRWPIPYHAGAPRADQATPSLRIATSAALLAAKLRGEPLGESVDLKTLSNLISGLPEPYRNADRVQQLQLMIQQTRQLNGE
jgi:hypothetical protein